jgi:hypothetical protein
MASATTIFMTRVRLKVRKQGRKRKNQINNKGTTPTQSALFGDTAKSK